MWQPPPYSDRTVAPPGPNMNNGHTPIGEGNSGRRYEKKLGPSIPPPGPPLRQQSSSEMYHGPGLSFRHGPPPPPLLPPPSYVRGPYGDLYAHHGSYYPPLAASHGGNAGSHGHGIHPTNPPHQVPPGPRPYPPARPYYDHPLPSPMETRGPENETDQTRQATGCTCKKSRCLKLYCACFSSSTTCGPKCRCSACHNTMDHANDIESARCVILERNPSAFDDKFAGQRHRPHWEVQHQWQQPMPPPLPAPEHHPSLQRAWFSYSHDPLQQQEGPPAQPPPTVPPPPKVMAQNRPVIPVSRPQVTHKNGCKCRKTFCLKKYCECYNRGAQCGTNCRCSSCRNNPAAYREGPFPSTGKMRQAQVMPTIPPMPNMLKEQTWTEQPTHPVSTDNVATSSSNPPQKEDIAMAALAMTELIGSRSSPSDDGDVPRKRKISEDATTATQPSWKKKSLPSPTSEDEQVRAVVSAGSMSPTQTIESRNASPVGVAQTQKPRNAFTALAEEREGMQVYEGPTRKLGLPKALSFRKICSKCGKTRGEHGELGFGHKCVYQDCGRCGAGVQMHVKSGVPMGILCTLAVEDGAIPGHAEMYTRKIRDLAVRAQIQRGLKGPQA